MKIGSISHDVFHFYIQVIFRLLLFCLVLICHFPPVIFDFLALIASIGPRFLHLPFCRLLPVLARLRFSVVIRTRGRFCFPTASDVARGMSLPPSPFVSLLVLMPLSCTHPPSSVLALLLVFPFGLWLFLFLMPMGHPLPTGLLFPIGLSFFLMPIHLFSFPYPPMSC